MFQKSELIEIDAEIGGIEIFCQSFVGEGAGIVKMIQMDVGKNEIAEIECLRGLRRSASRNSAKDFSYCPRVWKTTPRLFGGTCSRG